MDISDLVNAFMMVINEAIPYNSQLCKPRKKFSSIPHQLLEMMSKKISIIATT